jgi:hypothetical protein
MWFQEPAFNGLLDPELTFYSGEELFNSSSFVSSQKNRYWSKENPRTLHEVLLHDSKVVKLLGGV